MADMPPCAALVAYQACHTQAACAYGGTSPYHRPANGATAVATGLRVQDQIMVLASVAQKAGTACLAATQSVWHR